MALTRRRFLLLSRFPPGHRAATLAAIVTAPFRILSLLLCLLVAGPMSTPAWALARPETRVGEIFSSPLKSTPADLDQTLEPRGESRGCDYDFASSVCKYLYAHGNPVNGTDPSGHEFTVLGVNLATAIQYNSRTLEGVAVAAFKARALQTLTFKVGAWAIISATAATTIGGVVAVVASSSTSDEEVNEEIEVQIEQAKRQRKKMRFFHYTPRTHGELAGGLFAGQFGALRGNIHYYEARAGLGVGDPKYVYPVDIDPIVTPVIPRGLVPANAYGFGGEPQVEFPFGTPSGSVQPGRETPR